MARQRLEETGTLVGQKDSISVPSLEIGSSSSSHKVIAKSLLLSLSLAFHNKLGNII
jgi:hypothetical protein